MTQQHPKHPLASLPWLSFDSAQDLGTASTTVVGTTMGTAVTIPATNPATNPATSPTKSLATNLATSLASIPDDETCFALWDCYDMLDNIRAHSLKVADFATVLAQKAVDMGHTLCVASVRASALLHDIAKSYTIAHGGSHAQMGASIVIQHTGNRHIAQGVAMHVHWPWEIPQNVCALPFFIIYADKRIMHHQCVTLKTRYEDLLARYGTNELHRENIRLSYQQGLDIEKALSALLECDLHAYTFNSGRMVKRKRSVPQWRRRHSGSTHRKRA